MRKLESLVALLAVAALASGCAMGGRKWGSFKDSVPPASRWNIEPRARPANPRPKSERNTRRERFIGSPRNPGD